MTAPHPTGLTQARPRIRAFAVGIGLTALMIGSGCATTRGQNPNHVLRDYASALEEGRADDAYRMLSDDARRAVSLEAFRKLVHDNPDEAREMARALRRPTGPPVVTATVTTPEGHELELVLEDGEWRVDTSAVDFYAQDTPRHAVRGFVRALERKRYDVLLRYVPEGHLEGLDSAKLKKAWEGPDREEIQHVLLALKQALPAATIEETGDRATLSYGAGTLQLVREHGVWKIEDFD